MLRSLALAALVAAALRAAASAGVVQAEAEVREAFGGARPWEALPLAEALSARSDLDGPRKAWALSEAARVRATIGDAGGAEADLRRALAVASGDAVIALELAQLLRGERPDEALRYAGEAARAPDQVLRTQALRLSGEIRLDIGDTKGAAEALTLALREDAGDFDALAAMARAERERPAGAVSWAERAEAAARQTPRWYRGSALRAAARLWRELGEDARAAAAYDAALAEDPDDLDALQGLLGIPERERARSTAAAAPLPEAPTARAGELETLRASIDAALGREDAAGALALADRFLEAAPRAPAWRQPDAYRLIAERLLAMGPAARSRAQGASWRAYTLCTHSVAVARLLSRTRPVPDTPTAPGSPEFAGREYASAAQARERLGDAAGARDTIARGLRVAPDCPELLLAAGRPDRALAALPSLGPGLEVGVRARVLREKARAQRADGDAAAAERTLDEALALVPEDREALDEAADLAMSRRLWRRALGYLEPLLGQLALRADERGAARRRKAKAQAALGEAAAAEETLRQALAEAPGDAQTLGQLIELELERGEAPALADARRLVEAQAKAAPSDRAAALVRLAKAQHAAHDDAGAEAGLGAALRLDIGRWTPFEKADAFLLQARILRGRKDAAGAEASLERAIALAPSERGALIEAIGLELERGRPRQALARARELVSVSTGDGAEARAAAYWRLAQAERASGDPRAARGSLERALSLAPGDVMALADLFDLELEAGEARAAETLLEKHVPSAGASSRAAWLVRRGLARAALGEDAPARRDFVDAVAGGAEAACRGPGLPARRDRLPFSYFDACLARFPSDVGLHEDDGVALYRAGRTEAAVAELRRAVALAPGDARAQLSLVSALASVNRPAEALAAADRAVAALGRGAGPVYDELLALRVKLKAGDALPRKH